MDWNHQLSNINKTLSFHWILIGLWRDPYFMAYENPPFQLGFPVIPTANFTKVLVTSRARFVSLFPCWKLDVLPPQLRLGFGFCCLIIFARIVPWDSSPWKNHQFGRICLVHFFQASKTYANASGWDILQNKSRPPIRNLPRHTGVFSHFAARPCIPGPLRLCCDVIDHKWMLDWQGASLAFVGLQSWEVELIPGKLTLNVAWMETSPYLSIILVVSYIS